MPLDLTQPYGRINNDALGRVYEQDGVIYKGDGSVWAAPAEYVEDIAHMTVSSSSGEVVHIVRRDGTLVNLPGGAASVDPLVASTLVTANDAGDALVCRNGFTIGDNGNVFWVAGGLISIQTAADESLTLQGGTGGVSITGTDILIDGLTANVELDGHGIVLAASGGNINVSATTDGANVNVTCGGAGGAINLNGTVAISEPTGSYIHVNENGVEIAATPGMDSYVLASGGGGANLQTQGSGWTTVSAQDTVFITGGDVTVQASDNKHILLTTGGASGGITLDAQTGGLIKILDLPTSDPVVAGALWNNAGTLKISAG